VSRRK